MLCLKPCRANTVIRTEPHATSYQQLPQLPLPLQPILPLDPTIISLSVSRMCFWTCTYASSYLKINPCLGNNISSSSSLKACLFLRSHDVAQTGLKLTILPLSTWSDGIRHMWHHAYANVSLYYVILIHILKSWINTTEDMKSMRSQYGGTASWLC